MTYSKTLASLLTSSALIVSPAVLADVTLTLNWTPTVDHAPYYYAKQQGWYEEAGIDVSIESGRGSGATAQRVGSGRTEFGIADMATALVAKSQGAELTAIMSVYTNSPQGFYWLKSSGIEGPEDFPGNRIGSPPADASRVMWPFFAAKVGIDPDSVQFVNVSPAAKIASLKSGSIEITSDFYNEHDLKVREFGDDLGFVAWRDIGINPYGNSVIVNTEFLQEDEDLVADFSAISQRAFAACVEDVDPCLDALMAEVSGLDRDNQYDQWQRVKELMTDTTTTEVALGAFDAERMQADYELVKEYMDMEVPFDIETTYTNEYLDDSLKMQP